MTGSSIEVSADQRNKAAAFRSLHDDGIFVMPCAWDAGSALVLEAAGFASLGTTSGGVNWSRGRRDYVYAVSRQVMLDDYGLIAEAATVPVSADLENGYGAGPDDVGATVVAAIASGLVGGSIEDQSSDPGPGLLPVDVAAERIAAARVAADSVLPEFVLTARAESYYGAVADPLGDAIERANAYVGAGADCVFVPGPSDLDTLRALVDSVDAPISVGIGSGGGALTLDDLRSVGIRRVSTGGAIPRLLYARIAAAAREMLDHGTFGFTTEAMTDTELEEILQPSRGNPQR